MNESMNELMNEEREEESEKERERERENIFFSILLILFHRRLFRKDVLVPEVMDPNQTNQLNEYFVKWEGLPYEECTWEAWKDVSIFYSKIEEYRKRLEGVTLNRAYIGYVKNLKK